MTHKLGICIPYRDRKDHIEQLIPHLSKKLNEQNINHTFYVGHQIDEKLFNRGAMKNIAAKIAFDDGCDYVAWHDVDMLSYDINNHIGGDYNYPYENPVHIATKLSKYNYGLGYDQYFGGVVLFTKEQAYRTNGYSNDYWDWGQEDDDLFWRCYYENFTTGRIIKKYKNRTVANFNGNDSYLEIPTNKEISTAINNEFTISILFYAEQQPDKVPIWLVGDEEKKFIEYPIIRKSDAWTWGLSFNNSRAVTMVLFDENSQHHYNWAKRFENLWTWVTLSFNSETKESYLYINDEMVCQMNGVKENKPFPIDNNLRQLDFKSPFLIGKCSHQNTFFKGKVAEIKIFNKHMTDIEKVINENDNLVLHYNFSIGKNELINGYKFTNNNVNFTDENIELIENILPHRREGSFYCLYHKDEGYVNGKWAKGKTTARNEKRFVTEMQQKLLDYKNDGLDQILDVLDIVNIDDSLYTNTKFINVKMK